MSSKTKPQSARSAKPRRRRRAASADEVRPRPGNHSQATAVISAARPPVPLDDLLQRAAVVARQSRSANTQRTYNSALRSFGKFAAGQGRPAFPATAHVVAGFLQSRIDAGASPASLNIILTALRISHRAANQPDPTADQNVRALMKGYRRILAKQGRRSRQAKGLSESDLAVIIAVARKHGDDIRTARDIAVVSLLREGLLRRDECASLSARDFSREADGSGRLLITRSKTDQDGEGCALFLGEQIAAAVDDWVSRAPAAGDAPMFRQIRRGGHVQPDGLSDHSINAIIQKRGKDAGIVGLSGHSGRVGMAQDLVANGFSIGDVATAGRWKSSRQVLHYASRQAAVQGAVARYRGKRG